MTIEELERLCAPYPRYEDAPVWVRELFDSFWAARGR